MGGVWLLKCSPVTLKRCSVTAVKSSGFEEMSKLDVCCRAWLSKDIDALWNPNGAFDASESEWMLCKSVNWDMSNLSKCSIGENASDMGDMPEEEDEADDTSALRVLLLLSKRSSKSGRFFFGLPRLA